MRGSRAADRLVKVISEVDGGPMNHLRTTSKIHDYLPSLVYLGTHLYLRDHLWGGNGNLHAS